MVFISCGKYFLHLRFFKHFDHCCGLWATAVDFELFFVDFGLFFVDLRPLLWTLNYYYGIWTNSVDFGPCSLILFI